jgi:hypothetical protein
MPAVSAALVVIVVLSFVAATQFPPAAFNIYDDLEKYFAFPTRMLTTGTLAGSPLNALGSETLGGQAWLQGFFLALLPIPYINGFDALLCLGLAMLLVIGFAGTASRWMPVGAFAALVLVAIDPQYVNVSALYCGVALSMAAIVWLVEQPPPGGWRDGLVPGLFCAALIACKSSLGLMPVLLIVCYAAVRAIGQRQPGAAAAAALKAGLWTVLLLAPWFVLYVGIFAAAHKPLLDSAGQLPFDLGVFFSANRLPYGAAALYYSAAIVAAGALAAFSFVTAKAHPLVLTLSAACLAGALAFFGGTSIMAVHHSSFPSAFRYGLIDVLIVVPLVCAAAWRWQSRFEGTVRALSLVLGLSVLADFAPALALRIDQAWTYGHTLAFEDSITQPYLAYSTARQSDFGAARGRRAQDTIPPGLPVVVWTASPFELDYARNPIVDVEPAGLATPWATVPPANYLIWEYRGYAVRTPDDYNDDLHNGGDYERLIARRGLAFLHTLDTAVRSGRILFNDGYVVVVQLAAPLGQEWRSAAH